MIDYSGMAASVLYIDFSVVHAPFEQGKVGVDRINDGNISFGKWNFYNVSINWQG